MDCVSVYGTQHGVWLLPVTQHLRINNTKQFIRIKLHNLLMSFACGDPMETLRKTVVPVIRLENSLEVEMQKWINCTCMSIFLNCQMKITYLKYLHSSARTLFMLPTIKMLFNRRKCQPLHFLILVWKLNLNKSKYYSWKSFINIQTLLFQSIVVSIGFKQWILP